MNDLTKPSTLIAGVNTLGLVTAGIYFSRQNTTLNARINDVTDEVETIKDGLKEKVPSMENTIKTMDLGLRSLANSLQNMHNTNGQLDGRIRKNRDKLSDLAETLDALDQRFVNLVEALIAKEIIKKEDVDPPSKVVTKTRGSEKDKKKSKSKHRRDETESEESSSESSESEHDRRDNRRGDNRRDNRRSDNRRPQMPQMPHQHHYAPPYPQQAQPRRAPQPSMNNDDDDIDVVARMASGRK
jgi:hypothetical protein